MTDGSKNLNNLNETMLFHDGIDVTRIAKTIFANIKFFSVQFSLLTVLVVIYAISLPNIYTSKAILSESNNFGAPSQNLSSGSGLSTLTSLAGLSLGEVSLKTNEAIQTLKSYGFFLKLINNHEIFDPIMASTGWDSSTNNLVYNDFYDPKERKWKKNKANNSSYRPTNQEAYEYFRQIFGVTQDIDTGFVVLSFKHYSPHVSKRVIDSVIQVINEEFRKDKIKQAERSLDYLKPQFQESEVSEVRVMVATLIQEQIKNIMLAESSPEYLFKVIDSPYASEFKSEPKRSVICIIGAIICLVISLISTFIYAQFFKGKSLNLLG